MRPGYHGRALNLLERYKANVGDVIRVYTPEPRTGVVMPRYGGADDSHIVIKLDSGYNVGIPIRDVTDVKLLQESTKSPPPPPVPPHDAKLPNVLLVATGGTIASRVDYRTGAVTPALDAKSLGSLIPEIYRMANVRPLHLFSEYSENITPEQWVAMADTIHKRWREYDGVVVAHGTDTMHYTAAYLSFALAGCGVPIILTGSQRSTDRASSDGAMNLTGAVSAIKHKVPPGVYVAMHHTRSDDIIAIHCGTRVRKNHTSSRDAFRTISGEPAYLIQDDNMTPADPPHRYWHAKEYSPRISINRGAALVKYHPGYDTAQMRHMAKGCRAIILEGTGLGHVGREAYPHIRRMIDDGTWIGMTSQCIGGRVRMTVYESGRDLLDMGVVPLHMTPETALVKAMWAISCDTDIHDAMTCEMASEMI